jgi:hypothetical protein
MYAQTWPPPAHLPGVWRAPRSCPYAPGPPGSTPPRTRSRRPGLWKHSTRRSFLIYADKVLLFFFKYADAHTRLGYGLYLWSARRGRAPGAWSPAPWRSSSASSRLHTHIHTHTHTRTHAHRSQSVRVVMMAVPVLHESLGRLNGPHLPRRRE